MGKFENKIIKLRDEIIRKIISKVHGSKNKSVFIIDSKAIVVNDEIYINLGNDRYIKEIIEIGFLDDYGYHYSFNSISLEDLAIIADKI